MAQQVHSPRRRSLPLVRQNRVALTMSSSSTKRRAAPVSTDLPPPKRQTSSGGSASSWRPESSYRPLAFCAFVAERQAVHERRQAGLPREEWTEDAVLQHGRFCCIDRRDDAVTQELLVELDRLPTRRQKIVLAIVLRFTSSRRGAAVQIASLLQEDVDGGAAGGGKLHTSGTKSRLVAALDNNQIACGQGTYQMTLKRPQIGRRAEACATAVESHVATHGPFDDVMGATDFIKQRMALRKADHDSDRDMVPAFSAAEAAKDLAYMGEARAARTRIRPACPCTRPR